MTRGETMIGHRWAPRAGVSPAVVLVALVRGRYPNHVNRVEETDSWIMDYEFTPHGRGRTAPRGLWMPRPANSVHIYPPRTLFWEDTRGLRGTRHSAWVYFKGGDDVGLMRLVQSERNLARLLDEAGAVGEELEALARIGQAHGEGGFWLAQACLCRAIALCLSSAPSQDGSRRIALPAEQKRNATLAERVDDLARQSPESRLTLTQIASRLHISVSQLSHRYREATGQTPKAALTRRTIDHAQLLLLKGLPLKNVADQLGFCDAFHLSKVFRRVTGRSPRQYLEASRRPA
jgi:AraC-like DNA-binding protein